MAFFKKLFGGGGGEDAGAEPGSKVLGSEEYQGYTIRATEMKAGSEFQLCGEVVKQTEAGERVHTFIRADRLPSADMAVSASLAKGRQIIDEQGENLFS